MNSWLGVLVLGSLAVACGSTSSNPKDEPAAGAPNGGTAGDAAPSGDGEGGEGGTNRAPPAQGASNTSIKSVSPVPAGKMCPSGAAFTSAVPSVADPNQMLDDTTYLERVVDGADEAAVTCRVAALGAGSFTIEGSISQGVRSLSITDGVLDGQQGTARIAIMDRQSLSGTLASPAATCQLDIMSGSLQVQAGAVWAKFTCPSVESPPSDYCAASGFFVLENCDQ